MSSSSRRHYIITMKLPICETSDKYLFLDFDGVLNTEFYQDLLLSLGKQWQDEHGAFFDPEAVKQLRRIIDVTQASIVIESSWKYLGLKAIQEMWHARHLPGRVIDITPSYASDSWLQAAGLNETDLTHCKGIEIACWLFDHVSQETRYVIIDDEYVILDSQIPHFVMTNPFDGITEEVANRAIAILNI